MSNLFEAYIYETVSDYQRKVINSNNVRRTTYFSRLGNQRRTKASIYTTPGNKTIASSNSITADKY